MKQAEYFVKKKRRITTTARWLKFMFVELEFDAEFWYIGLVFFYLVVVYDVPICLIIDSSGHIHSNIDFDQRFVIQSNSQLNNVLPLHNYQFLDIRISMIGNFESACFWSICQFDEWMTLYLRQHSRIIQ